MRRTRSAPEAATWAALSRAIFTRVLAVALSVNGEPRQASNTSDMICSVAHIVSYVSQFMPLLPGDVVRLSMDRLGTQSQRCT